jgi:hypothetical protein
MKRESQHDLENEMCAVRLLRTWKQVEAHKLPLKYICDFALYAGGRLAGFAEFKRRKVSVEKYPTVILSLHKAMVGTELAEVSGTKFLFVVQWDDAFGYHVITRPFSSYKIQQGGTFHRCDQEDVEPVIHLPFTGFKFMGED